jgi:hypothetical protein
MDNPAFTSLRDQLTQLDILDLRAVLSSVFHHAGYHGDRKVTYSSQVGPALSVVYLADGKKGRDPMGVVGELQAEPGLTEENVRQLQEQLAIVRDTSSDLLTSFFHFSYLPVTGWWRYRDQFQLLPPPSGAPLPSFVMADHPFLIEACYAAPDHHQARSNRRMRAMRQLRLLLPVLLRGPIYQPHTERPVKHWVLPMPTGELPVRTRERTKHLSGLPARRRSRRSPLVSPQVPIYAQEYYEVVGRPLGGSRLSEVEGIPPMTVVDDHDAYYRASGISADDVLAVPAVLTQLFDNYFALSEDVAKRYLRACYWLNMGRFFHAYSFSASFFADVAAIEVMLPGGEGPHDCSGCGFPHYPSISKEFRAFVAEYVPDKPDRETFYDMRSKIAHGSSLLHSDMREELGGFYPGELEQYEQRSKLRQVSRVALMNWLLAQNN